MVGMHTVDPRSIRSEDRRESEDGFLLVGLIVAIFLVLLALGVAAPKMSEALKRDREVEAVHRGNQYMRAIRLYYRKFGHYPGSMDQLEKTNNIRFLRQRYIDPMTGKEDWRLIHVGEAKTTVKGFFGQPLAGMTPGLGSAAGMASGSGIGAGAAGSSAQSGSSGAFGNSSYGNSSFGNSSSGSSGLGGSTMPALGGSSSSGTPTLGGGTGSSGPPTLGGSSSGSSSTPGQSNGLGSASGIQSSGTPSGGAPFVGVGIPKDGDSITVLNEQTTYDTWEFLYDPRIEQLYAKGSLFGGGASGLGSAGGNSSGFGNTTGSGTAPGGFGTTPGGFGTSPGTTSPTTPATPLTTPPQ
jgi:type II secretory pathway pseudopilin PulG